MGSCSIFTEEVQEIIKEIDSISLGSHISRSGLAFQRIQKIKANCTDDEMEQILHLVESHVPTLREKTAMRYERLLMKNECDDELAAQLRYLKEIIVTRCPRRSQSFQGQSPKGNAYDFIIKQVAEMPKEWKIIQLTSDSSLLEFHNIDAGKYQTSALHITVFNCGQSKVKPFKVTVREPEINGNKIELVQELMDTISENRERLLYAAGRKKFKDQRERYNYYQKREETEQMLKGIVRKVEENWLREWRCLLIGNYQDEVVEGFIKSEVDNIIKKYSKGTYFHEREKELLYQITKGTKYLQSFEVLKAIQHSFLDVKDESKIKEICRCIKEIDAKIDMKYGKVLRHPIILVVDECIDSFPWEMLDVLEDEPVSRVPSLHFAYFLFKAHEKEIENGHKIIRTTKGTYVVNPDRDLVNMENRMMSFYNYWVPDWKGIFDRKPTSDEFYDLLEEADIFSYSGHGNGSHIMTIELLQRINLKAVVLLFGCGSTRITQLGPQVEMYGSYHMYLISRCPCVLGMLWEVTDIDTDVLTTQFLSNWISSKAPIHWSNVDKNQWRKAIKTDKFVAAHKAEGTNFSNSELLRALWYSKKSTEYFLTKAACVVRGLPVKIQCK